MPTELNTALDSVIFLMPNWKWLVLAIIIFGGLMCRPFLQSTIKKLRRKSPLTKNESKTFWSYLVRLDTDSAVSWVTLTLVWLFLIDGLQIHQGWDKYLTGIFKILFAFNLIRFVYTAIDAVGSLMIDVAAKSETSLDDQLAPFAAKSLKILVIILGVLISLQNFGVNVMSLLAGLGLGGLALALAAQDTVANLFGSITILLDAPFKIGDHVKVTDVEGTVEEVGFRSTRIRTTNNSLVVIPNSIVAKEKVENLAERKLRQIRQVLGLHYDTSPEKITHFCDGVKYLLKSEPLVIPDTIVVSFNNYNASTLDVIVRFQLQTIDAKIELETTQKLFLEIWKTAKTLEVEFAYPTQTIYLPKMV